MNFIDLLWERWLDKMTSRSPFHLFYSLEDTIDWNIWAKVTTELSVICWVADKQLLTHCFFERNTICIHLAQSSGVCYAKEQGGLSLHAPWGSCSLCIEQSCCEQWDKQQFSSQPWHRQPETFHFSPPTASDTRWLMGAPKSPTSLPCLHRTEA